MRETTFKIHQGEWKKLGESIQRLSTQGNNKKGMIKTRLSFIYFVVLVASIIVIFTK